MFRSSVILTTFNSPAVLGLVLESLYMQTVPAYDIVIADDGSTHQTRMVISSWINKLPVTHVWQSDQNFRAARVRNLAIKKARGEHLIFIDGDCVVPRNFISAHKKLIKEKYLIAGGRKLLSKSETEVAVRNKTVPKFDHWKFLRLPLGLLRDLNPRGIDSVRTCNVGVMKVDLLSVGGFDETYVGWGREDTDLVVRLIRKGIRVRSGRFFTTLNHLFHVEECRDKLSLNDAHLVNVIQSVRTDPLKSCLTEL